MVIMLANILVGGITDHRSAGTIAIIRVTAAVVVVVVGAVGSAGRAAAIIAPTFMLAVVMAPVITKARCIVRARAVVKIACATKLGRTAGHSGEDEEEDSTDEQHDDL